MTAGAIFGFICFVIMMALQIAASEKHRDETGVAAPSRKAMARMRRNARKKGISNGAAYDQWLHNKQVRAGILPTQRELAALRSAGTPAATLQATNSPAPAASNLVRDIPAPLIDVEPVMLRECRRYHGIDLGRLSAATGLSKNMLGQIENGTRAVPDDVIDKLKAAIRALHGEKPEALTDYRIALPRAPRRRSAMQSSEVAPINTAVVDPLAGSPLNLAVTVRDWTPEADKPGAFFFNFDLHCTLCGGVDVEVPGNEPSDHSPASCKACGERFGSWGEVQAKATDVAHAYMRERRMGAYAEVEPSA